MKTCWLQPRPTMTFRTSTRTPRRPRSTRSEEHTSELQSPDHLVCRLLLEKKKKIQKTNIPHMHACKIQIARTKTSKLLFKSLLTVRARTKRENRTKCTVTLSDHQECVVWH